MNRRDFAQALVEAVASYALFQTLFGRDAFGRSIRPVTDAWVRTLHEQALDLQAGRITPRMWQEQIHALYAQVALEDLVRLIDFARLTQDFPYPDAGVHTRRVTLPPLTGLPDRLAFHSKIFGMRRDRAIIPHGHRNMVSCHYVLQGELHLRHYDKVEEDATHMVIAPTVDAAARPGSYSSISDAHHNVHWLHALTETAFTFDVLVLDLGGARWEVDNIDPWDAEPIGGGLPRTTERGPRNAP
jgi:hypothetical protein